ncbi:MAG TPA: hypothetical protein PKC45_01445, partial [Gemmatales bacterium]|nr:hypothetical protein [Gemmatales bacterium]
LTLDRAEVLAGASYMSGLLVVAGLWGLHRLRRCLPTGGTRGWLVVMVEALGLAVLAPLLDGWFHGEAVRCFHLALFVATLPAAVGLRTLVGWLGGTSGRVWARITKVALAGTVVAVVVLLMPAASGPDWPLQVAPLPVGISPGVEQLMAQLREATEPTARILWEDDATTEPWSPLLPAWTDRHFIGGLSRQGPIEHLQWHLGEGQWRGRRLADWSDSELDRCVTSLNIGWIVAHSQGVLARCAAWPTADRPVPLAGGRHLIPLRRPHSYILHGQARVDTLDQRRITLVDVEPEDGVVLLSLHYHLTLRSTTNRVTLSPAAHLDGSVPLTRLHVPGPLSRLTINWD